VETDLTLLATGAYGGGYGGIVVWYHDANNWISVFLYPYLQKIGVYSNINGSKTENYYPFSSLAQTAYHLKVAANSDTGVITVFVDDSQEVVHTTNSIYRTGLSGVNCGNAGAIFDNLSITPEGSTTSLLDISGNFLDKNYWKFSDGGNLNPSVILYEPDNIVYGIDNTGIWWKSSWSRGGGQFSTRDKYFFNDVTITAEWSGNGGGTFDQPLWVMYNSEISEIRATWFSYGNSYDGTTLIQPDVHYKTTFVFKNNNCQATTVDQNGNTVQVRNTPIDLSQSYYIGLRHGDNYAYNSPTNYLRLHSFTTSSK
jgi:hypothetical protein